MEAFQIQKPLLKKSVIYYERSDDSFPDHFSQFSARPSNGMSTQLFLLNAVAIVWGTQHLVIQDSVCDFYPSASFVNSARFCLAALCFVPPVLLNYTNVTNSLVLAGAELGLYQFLGFGFQAVGLATTGAARSAFLLYLNVKFVPLLALLLYGRPPGSKVVISCLLAFGGTFALVYSPETNGLVIGDLWSAAAALASAFFILRLESATQYNPATLTAISTASAAGLCLLWLGCDVVIAAAAAAAAPASSSISVFNIASSWVAAGLSEPLPLLYLGLVVTGLCSWLQAIGQRGVPAERAAVIYSLDPVYAAVFSYVFKGEKINIFGILLILAGVLVANTDSLPVFRKSDALSDKSAS